MPKRYLVPQHIEMEDKLVGPLTLTQFLYLLGGGILSYSIISSPLNRFIAVPLVLMISSFFLAMAFFKINDQSFPRMLWAIILYFMRPRDRYWGKEQIKEAHVEEMKNLSKQKRLNHIFDFIGRIGWSPRHVLEKRVQSPQNNTNKTKEKNRT